MDDFLLFGPEVTVLVAALITLLMATTEVSYRMLWSVSIALSAAVLVVTAASMGGDGEPFFPGIYRVDRFSQLLKLGIAAGLLASLLVSADVGSVRPRTRLELPFFLFVSCAGMMMLVSATELLTFFVALELSAYGLYILAALNRAGREGSETAAKYVLFGAASSAVSLYGISLIFGVTRTTYMADIAHLAAQMSPADTPLLAVGALLFLANLFFKLGVFPFHAWAPDTYQGSPHQAATFIGTVSKIAAVGILVRILSLFDPDANNNHLTGILIGLCILSMTVGNLAAIAQSDLKRLLGYSTVAHAGYMLIGLLAFSELGMAAAVFYALVYLPMVLCPFLVVCVLGRDGSNPTLSSMAGLHRRSPLCAALILIGMFGLAGIPPTPGFAGKWFLFAAVLERSGFMFWLVLIAAINATISLYYYLKVVKAVYLSPAPAKSEDHGPGGGDGSKPSDEQCKDYSAIHLSPAYKVAGFLAIAMVALCGFYPNLLWDWAVQAARAIGSG
ncbi:MAG: NADH-quinone oxidoreductase subunit N [Proteobacteria bacterium]|nr:NADH-quinone oxidoreductase subunit N [Pseudomonadota bacterium]